MIDPLVSTIGVFLFFSFRTSLHHERRGSIQWQN